jgi:hypothetical protein
MDPVIAFELQKLQIQNSDAETLLKFLSINENADSEQMNNENFKVDNHHVTRLVGKDFASLVNNVN